eukprot:CAMPEP_0196587216 /NCGR_PEP_ID=MMETSP1081-20130531/56767_1 /TAXON_ID=36882 /ORGANISM="Pyramimonas amylifera, Strain CCMP720" /LENGTH=60 /DNA_ID=CAMNT_0041909335 /DNA_START=373 /DNA_END=555 /DNA_ORIENTATION=+
MKEKIKGLVSSEDPSVEEKHEQKIKERAEERASDLKSQAQAKEDDVKDTMPHDDEGDQDE